MHISQIFLLLALSFLIGAFAGSFVAIPQALVWGGALICAALIAVFFRRGSSMLNPRLTLAVFLVLFSLFGIARFNLANSRQHVLEKFAKAQAGLTDPRGSQKFKLTIQGYIDDQPDRRSNKQKVVLKAQVLEVPNRLIKIDEKVLVTARLYPEYRYGQAIKVAGNLELPENFADSDFDYRAYLAKDGIYTLMYYPDISEGKSKPGFWESVKLPLFKKIFFVKDKFESAVNRSLAEPNASFVNGILLGSRSQLPDDVKRDFSRTGTSHILAVSGYNITIVAEVISWLLLLFLRRQTAFWFSVAGVAIFTILTGAQAAVVRAAIMGVLLLIANREGRLYGAKNAIVSAAAVMVLVSPAIIRYDVGFQLSFLASLGLVLFSPILERRFEKVPELFKFKETLLTTISAQILVLPLILYDFKNLSLLSLPANILILPLVPYAMFLGFITGIAGWIWPVLGQVVGVFAWLVSGFQLGVVRLLARPSWSAISFQIPWYLMVLVYAAIAFGLNRALARKRMGVDR